jgi:pimeloyl-ACP methyl ester carboxylesterase
MRILHFTVALLLAAGVVGGPREALAQGGSGTPSAFTVFIRGVAVGSEEVTVTRTAEGMTIGGTSRIGPPLSLTIRRAHIVYAPDGRPVQCTLEGSVGEQLLGIRTVVSGTTATTDATQGTETTRKTDQVGTSALLLPNAFFGGYQALASRLIAAKTGDEISAYVTPQASIALRVGPVGAEETIRTPSGAVRIRRYSVHFANPGQPLDAEVWVESGGLLVRLVVASQSLDYARNDIVSVASRREPVSHPGDEHVGFPANGFVLASTLTKPTATLPKGTRLPAVVLVSGGADVDRDESVRGIPIFGQLASSVADAGFIVVRYDKRGVGQSGGRNESVTLTDYSEDVRAIVKGLRKRKDVDSKRIAVVGYGEGGAVAMVAAQKDEDIKALILLATPGVAGADFVLEQQARALSKMTIDEADKQARVDLQKKINQAVLAGRGWEGVPPAVRKQADTPWFQSWLAWDPAKVVPRVEQPILIVTGSLDREVAPDHARKLEALAQGRKKAAGRTVDSTELNGLNHLFVNATTGEVDEYVQAPDKTVSSQLPDRIATWLKGLWARK